MIKQLETVTDKKAAIFISQIVFIVFSILCLTPWISSAWALLAGILLALSLGDPFSPLTRKITPLLLQSSVVGLGAGMNLSIVGQVGAQGVGYTAIGIGLTLVLGLILGKWVKADDNTSLLVTVGTAICGGSAIAAVASTIRAKSHEVSVALATVFFLNAAALFVFPGVGHGFGLTESQFGLWSALAIHDTSSVVGAAIQYGAHSVEVATTVKLARALWIIPVSLMIGFFWKRNDEDKSVGIAKRPWFIFWFLVAAAIVTWFPQFRSLGYKINAISKRLLVLTLFLIGCGLSRATLKNVGYRPILQGLFLWVLMGSATLGAILIGWIR